ncbi:unnamed protein product, partial [Discosporangium mesarthrocarpum]
LFIYFFLSAEHQKARVELCLARMAHPPPAMWLGLGLGLVCVGVDCQRRCVLMHVCFRNIQLEVWTLSLRSLFLCWSPSLLPLPVFLRAPVFTPHFYSALSLTALSPLSSALWCVVPACLLAVNTTNIVTANTDDNAHVNVKQAVASRTQLLYILHGVFVCHDSQQG